MPVMRFDRCGTRRQPRGWPYHEATRSSLTPRPTSMAASIAGTPTPRRRACGTILELRPAGPHRRELGLLDQGAAGTRIVNRLVARPLALECRRRRSGRGSVVPGFLFADLAAPARLEGEPFCLRSGLRIWNPESAGNEVGEVHGLTPHSREVSRGEFRRALRESRAGRTA